MHRSSFYWLFSKTFKNILHILSVFIIIFNRKAVQYKLIHQLKLEDFEKYFQKWTQDVECIHIVKKHVLSIINSFTMIHKTNIYTLVSKHSGITKPRMTQLKIVEKSSISQIKKLCLILLLSLIKEFPCMYVLL